MGSSVIPANPFSSIPHPGSVAAQPPRRPPFASPFPYNTTTPGCRPTGPCPPLAPYSLPGHRHLFPWGSNLSGGPGEFYKPPPSAFTYYPRAMVAAAMAAVAASADKRVSLDDTKSGEGLDLSMTRFHEKTENQETREQSFSSISLHGSLPEQKASGASKSTSSKEENLTDAACLAD